MIRKRNSTKNTIMLDELNTAIAIGDYNSVNELLENNLDLNSTDTMGYFPIMVAVNNGNVDILKKLLAHGASPNAIDKRDGYSPLMKALRKKYLPNRLLIVKLLLQNGVDVNIMGKRGYTALQLARIFNTRYINLLKRFGAIY